MNSKQGLLTPSFQNPTILTCNTIIKAYFRPMKWIFGLISLGFLFVSCDNELVVTDEWKDIPVVWGLVSKSDTAHYIRVEKAYLDPTTSALAIARFPDSLYYENAVVTLKRISSGQVFTLNRVDGDLEGYPREGGIFAETPNYLYKIKANVINIMIGEKYEFGLSREDEPEQVIAETIILPKPVLRNPNPGVLLPFRSNSTYTFTWNAIPDAGIFDLHLTFHFRERSPETGNLFVPRSVSWPLVRSAVSTEFAMNGSDFYNSLKAYIAQNIMATRIFDSVDIELWCGGKELEEYIKITQANTGITSTQEIPGYTNLSEGIGLFTSRNVTYHTGYKLNNQALDSLKNGSVTRLLNFQ
jgi:hypothetical protein